MAALLALAPSVAAVVPAGSAVDAAGLSPSGHPAGTLGIASGVGSGAVASRGLTPAARRYPTPYRRSTRLVLVGDSLAQEATPFIQYLTAPKALIPKFWGGTAPCDWADVDLEATRRAVVVFSFTGNSLTDCMSDGAGGFLQDQALVDRYQFDVGMLIDRARRAGASVVLVGQPVRAASFQADEEVAGINAAYRAFAASMSFVSFVDAGATVELPDGTFAERLPCTSFDSECDGDGLAVVRGDGVHFCPLAGYNPCPVWSSGAFRFALAIAAAANDPRSFD